MDPTTAADTLKIVLLGDEVSFDCAVESADVTEVSIWWQKDEANLTITNEEKYSLKVKQREFFLRSLMRLDSIRLYFKLQNKAGN